MVGIGDNPSDCWAQELCYETGNVEGVVRAFLEKRKPKFSNGLLDGLQ
jgi:hypothetical protein